MDDIRDLLDAERTALTSGDFEEIERLSQIKAHFFEASANFPTDPGELEQINRMLRRNQELFRAALDGIQAAVDRMALLKDVRIETYLGDGQKRRISEKRSSRLERHA
ncbi:hypothetical protein [Litorisediminicola beolgyonensis]|uniref:FlgN protein n=1 Tax=Litorisediminicola beolgyonensis TaxID=1173614 RepID=A0ABW3ZHH0_9RHOB